MKMMNKEDLRKQLNYTKEDVTNINIINIIKIVENLEEKVIENDNILIQQIRKYNDLMRKCYGLEDEIKELKEDIILIKDEIRY